MDEGAAQPGWYPDPWQQGQMRWWDGTQWTSHLHGQVPITAAPAAPAARKGLSTGAIVAIVVGSVVAVLVVFVALISIPAFFNQRDKSRDADAKSEARTAQVAIETYATEAGSYAGATVADLQAIEPSAPADLELATQGNAYLIVVPSESGNRFGIERDPSGLVTFRCLDAGVAGCPESGDWG